MLKTLIMEKIIWNLIIFNHNNQIFMIMNLSEKLTIVIPCKNEGFTVKKSLDLLNLQSNIENVLILVSDFSDDFTKNLLSERKSDKFNLKLQQ